MRDKRKQTNPVRGKKRSVTSDLAQRIAQAQFDRSAGASAVAGESGGKLSGTGKAARLGTEFIAAVLVGAGMGYGLDLWLGTQPWLMLVMLLMGFGAGISNVVRVTAEMNAKNPAPLDADLGPGDDDEDEY